MCVFPISYQIREKTITSEFFFVHRAQNFQKVKFGRVSFKIPVVGQIVGTGVTSPLEKNEHLKGGQQHHCN